MFCCHVVWHMKWKGNLLSSYYPGSCARVLPHTGHSIPRQRCQVTHGISAARDEANGIERDKCPQLLWRTVGQWQKVWGQPFLTNSIIHSSKMTSFSQCIFLIDLNFVLCQFSMSAVSLLPCCLFSITCVVILLWGHQFCFSSFNIISLGHFLFYIGIQII